MRLWGMLIGVGMALGVVAIAADERRFFTDDPVWVDNDRIDTPNRPATIELSDLYDRLHHTFGQPGATTSGEASNVNTLDEVPDSAWFTNRHGKHRLSRAELKRGPNRDDGPDPRTIWTITGGKQGGLTPGFEMVDAKGVRYVIKLDPVGLPELSSAAEVIATKLFHAIGYNVPENHIVEVHPETFVIASSALIEDEFGKTHTLTERRLKRMLARIPRLVDGRVRVTASRYLDGEPIGPFRYYGTRSDDPNDIVPHEDRRELRGLRLFAAWMNHDDVRAHNTLDTWNLDGNRHYVRHHLIDFGSTFGSGTVDLRVPNLGFHSWLDLDLVRKNALGFGFHTPRYRQVDWPHFPEYASVGRFEAEAFDPEGWKPDYPNPAFRRMTDRDALWAAKIIAAFSREDLQAIVSTGRFSDPAQERYFLDTLHARQVKVLRRYLTHVNPLADFAVEEGQLTFVNLAESHNLVKAETEYHAHWMIYDNASDLYLTFTPVTVAGQPRIPIPVITLSADQYLFAEIRSAHPEHQGWDAPLEVYARSTNGQLSVVGIARASAGPIPRTRDRRVAP